VYEIEQVEEEKAEEESAAGADGKPKSRMMMTQSPAQQQQQQQRRGRGSEAQERIEIGQRKHVSQRLEESHDRGNEQHDTGEYSGGARVGDRDRGDLAGEHGLCAYGCCGGYE